MKHSLNGEAGPNPQVRAKVVAGPLTLVGVQTYALYFNSCI